MLIPTTSQTATFFWLLLQSKELPALSQSLAELSRKLGRGPAASVSEVDRLLAGQLGLLQQQLAGLAGRLDAREAAELEGQGVATREELQVTGFTG
jgi:hypothetical protein